MAIGAEDLRDLMAIGAEDLRGLMAIGAEDLPLQIEKTKNLNAISLRPSDSLLQIKRRQRKLFMMKEY